MVKRSTQLTSIPEWDRPRERLLALGPRALSATELLCVLVGSGSTGQSAFSVARDVLQAFKDLKDLAETPASALTRIRGCGVATSSRILAALELGRRTWLSCPNSPHTINGPEGVARLLMPEVRDLKKEIFYSIHLDNRNKLIDKEIISIGSLNASIVHPREVFRGALVRSAAAIIVSHNHPAGDVEPSKEDIEVTGRLLRAGKVLGVPLLDHVILGAGQYSSMKDLGLMLTAPVSHDSHAGD